MQNPATTVATRELIEHILSRYHNVHRREFPELIALAHKVEADYATDPNTPHGLTHALQALRDELEAHMRQEEDILFSGVSVNSDARVRQAIPEMRAAHGGQEFALNRIAAITHGFRLPHDACPSWRRLYKDLGKLVEDLDEHMYLENEVLFPRLESRG